MSLNRYLRARKSAIALLAGALLVTTMATACGSKKDTSTDSAAGATAGDPAVELNGLVPRLKAEKKYKIGLTLPQFRDPFWVSVAYGIEDEAKKSGLEVVVKNEAGSYADLGKQISQIDDMTQRKLDAILVAPVDRVGIAPALNNAGKAGIKIIGAGNLGNSDAMTVGVTFSHIQVGKQIADAIGEKLKGQGQIVMLNGPNGADWSILRNKGFKQELSSKYPGIKVIEEASVNPDRATGQKTMEDWLQKHGDKIDAVYSAVSLTAEGAVLALKSAGRNGKTFVGTSSLSEAALDMVKAGDIQFCYAEPGQLVGRLAVQYAIRQLEGKELPNVKPAEGDEPLPKNVVYIELPPVTPESAGKFNPRVLDWAADGYKV